MTLSAVRAPQVIAIALIATVVTQALYVAFNVNGDPGIAWPIWRTEALAMTIVAVLSLTFLPRHPCVAAGLLVGAIFNVIQTGMGLWQFSVLFEGGEAIQPVAGATLALSFFLYHAAKVALAIAGMAAGVALWHSASGLPKILGALAGIAGVVSFLANAYAMSFGMAATFIAGALGTVSVLLLALVLVHLTRSEG